MTPQICWPGKKGCWSRKHQLRGAQSLHPPICMSDSSPSLSTLFTAGKGQDYMMRCCNQEGPCMCTLLLNTVVSSLGTALYTLHLRFQVGRRDLPPTEVLWWLCSCWVHRGVICELTRGLMHCFIDWCELNHLQLHIRWRSRSPFFIRERWWRWYQYLGVHPDSKNVLDQELWWTCGCCPNSSPSWTTCPTLCTVLCWARGACSARDSSFRTPPSVVSCYVLNICSLCQYLFYLWIMVNIPLNLY